MTDFDLYSDEELMQEIKEDNMFAFDVLYKKYSKRLYKFGFSIIKTQEETENIKQDVFLNLWENRNKVKKDSSIKSYLFTIAYNLAISIIRKKARKLVFDKEPIDVVAKKLSRWFNVDFQVKDPELLELTYTATFDNETLPRVMELMAIVSPVNYTISDRKEISFGTFSKRNVILKC